MRANRYGSLLPVVGALVLMSFSVAAQTVIATVPVGDTPVALAVNPVTNKIFTVNQYGNSVTVIDGATNAIAATVKVGQLPGAVAVNAVTNKIYVMNRSGNAALTVIDGLTYSTTPLVNWNTPVALAVNPVTNRIYVVNQASIVTVLDGYTNTFIATVGVGSRPSAVAINTVTNKIYVSNLGDGSVTVIDGASNVATVVYTAQADPCALAVNTETNRIYVVNLGGTVSVLDGASNTLIANVPVGRYPCAVAISPSSNQIYVSNSGDGTVSVINGMNNAVTQLVVSGSPGPLTVMAATAKVYVTNSYGTVTMIDGVYDSIAADILVGSLPEAIAVDPLSNRIYVANYYDDTVSVIAGAGSDPLQFVAITPCRVADTRRPNGPFGGPPISGATIREFAIPNSPCGVPSSAAAYSLNVTVVPAGPLGYLTVWPSGQDQPNISTLNSLDGRIKANAAIVPAGASGAISIFASNLTNVVLDINGYFTAVSGSTLAFYPLTPCRVVDTRRANGPLGGPILQGGASGRDFPVTSSNCNIPANAGAYSLNFTAVPKVPLGYLTTWPAGQGQPGVSTLNAMTGVTTANAAIVPAGTGGDIQVFVSNDSHVVIDIDGYFAAASPAGLSLYATAPCRLLDTRQTRGAFVGTIGVSVVVSPCAVSSAAQAFVLSATVVPQGPLGYLTLWPDSQPQPGVSTLNAIDGAITSNMAIVPNIDGWMDAFASNATQLVLDISSYFGP